MTPPRKRKDAAQRAELVEAATRVVAENGVAGATTRRIAAEAGVPLGALHYWFATKDELLEEVVASHVNQLGAAAVAAAQDGDQDPASPFDDALKLLRAALFLERSADPGSRLASYELITWALRTPGHGDVARRQVEAFREVTARAMDSWMTTHAAGTPLGRDTAAQFVAALFDGLALATLADPRGTAPEEVVHLVSELLDAYVTRTRHPE